jgi:hypothetical protein
MTRWIGLVILMLLVIGLVTPAMDLSASAQTEEGGDPALESLATCLRERESLMVLFLMDESGSLQRTDPDAQRVVAANVALTNLQRLAAVEMGHRSPAIAVGLSAFTTEYNSVTPFTALDEDAAAELRRDIDSFAERNNGLDTDYATALEGALEDLSRGAAEISGETGVTPCRAIALFSDGDYDIELRNTEFRRSQGLTRPYAPDLPLDVEGNPELVIERGKAEICAGDGIRDQLVDDGAVLMTVALTDDISAEDTAWLEAVSVGSADGETCGTRVTAEDGSFFGADNLPGLIAAFDRVTQLLGGGSELPVEEELRVCERTFCAEGTREFELDETLSRFHLLGDLGAEEIRLEVRAPGETTPIALPADGSGSLTAGGADLQFDWLSPQAVTLDATLSRDNRDWVGTWSVTFIDPTGENPDAPAQSRIYLYGDVVPELVEVPQLRLGETAPVTVHLVDSLGTRLDTGAIQGSVAVSATVIDPTNEEEVDIPLEGPDVEGRYTASYPVPEGLEASFLSLRLRNVVTTAAGVRLAPFTSTYQLPVTPPVEYPRIETTELRLTPVTGVGTATGSLRIVGGDRTGCVWFEEASFARAPDEAGPLTTTLSPAAFTAEECLSIRAGETTEIDVAVENSELGSGRVEGTLGVVLGVEGEERQIRQGVPLSFDLARPVDQAVRALLFAALLLLCVLPILFMYLLNWLGAKFEAAHELLYADIPVVVGLADQIRRAGARDGRLLPVLEDFANVAGPATRSRRLGIGPLHLRGRVSRSPFKPPYGVAMVEGRHVASAGRMRKRGRWAKAEVPLALAGTWLFILNESATRESVPEDGQPDDGEIHGNLVLILSYAASGFASQVERLEGKLEVDLPSAARALAREAAKRAAASEKTEPEVPGVTTAGREETTGDWPPRPPDDADGQVVRRPPDEFGSSIAGSESPVVRPPPAEKEPGFTKPASPPALHPKDGTDGRRSSDSLPPTPPDY